MAQGAAKKGEMGGRGRRDLQKMKRQRRCMLLVASVAPVFPPQCGEACDSSVCMHTNTVTAAGV
jgi:hypothetical protein